MLGTICIQGKEILYLGKIRNRILWKNADRNIVRMKNMMHYVIDDVITKKRIKNQICNVFEQKKEFEKNYFYFYFKFLLYSIFYLILIIDDDY